MYLLKIYCMSETMCDVATTFGAVVTVHCIVTNIVIQYFFELM